MAPEGNALQLQGRRTCWDPPRERSRFARSIARGTGDLLGMDCPISPDESRPSSVTAVPFEDITLSQSLQPTSTTLRDQVAVCGPSQVAMVGQNLLPPTRVAPAAVTPVKHAVLLVHRPKHAWCSWRCLTCVLLRRTMNTRLSLRDSVQVRAQDRGPGVAGCDVSVQRWQRVVRWRAE